MRHKTLQTNNDQCELCGCTSSQYGLHIQQSCCLLLVAVMFVFLSLLLLMPIMLISSKIESHSCCAYSLHLPTAFKSVLCQKLILMCIKFQKYSLLFIFLLSLLLRSYLNNKSKALDSQFLRTCCNIYRHLTFFKL